MLRSHYHFRTEMFFSQLPKVLITDSSQLLPSSVCCLLRLTLCPSQSPFCGVSLHSKTSELLIFNWEIKVDSKLSFPWDHWGLCCITTQLLPLIHPISFISRGWSPGRSWMNLLDTQFHLIVCFLGKLTCNSCYHVYYRTEIWHNMISFHYERNSTGRGLEECLVIGNA